MSWPNLPQPETVATDQQAAEAAIAFTLDLEAPSTETADASPNMDWETILAGLKSFDETAPDGKDQAADNVLPPFPGILETEPAPTEEPAPTFSFEQLLSTDAEVAPAPAAPGALGLDLEKPGSGQVDSAAPQATSAGLFAAPPAVAENAPVETLDSWVDRLAAQQTMPLSEIQSRVGALVAEGRRLMEAGEPGEAIPKLMEALQIDPNSVDAREQLGVALYQKGRDEDAAREFRTIIGLKPDHAEAHANLGFILAEQGKADEAIDAFSAAIRYDSTLVEAHLGLAELYQNQNRLLDAVAEWKVASTLRPDLIEVHKFLGDAYVTLGRIEEAVLEYRVILERDQQNAYAHLRLGEIFIRMDHLSDAAKEFQRAIELDDTLAEAHYGLGVSLAEQGQRTPAIAHLERALALRPDYPEARSSIEDLQRQPQDARKQAMSAAPAGASGGEGKKRWGIFRWGKK
jgi:tetratricopeptide (TPR) repeat protein